MNEYGLDDQYLDNYMRANWSKIVNKALSAVAEPVKVKNRVLTIRTISEFWKRELDEKKDSLLKMINSTDIPERIEDIIVI